MAVTHVVLALGEMATSHCRSLSATLCPFPARCFFSALILASSNIPVLYALRSTENAHFLTDSDKTGKIVRIPIESFQTTYREGAEPSNTSREPLLGQRTNRCTDHGHVITGRKGEPLTKGRKGRGRTPPGRGFLRVSGSALEVSVVLYPSGLTPTSYGYSIIGKSPDNCAVLPDG